MANTAGTTSFSFQTPFVPGTPQTVPGASKLRRVSMALPESPRVVPVFRDDTGLDSVVPKERGKMRKISDTGVETERKQRKKWSSEETQMLVTGCNKHGVGNWKAILKDPELVFDGRSPVDLKDRFRTYFPDAYREHYPNAKTHLSTKVRSTLPDGSPLFEKTRSIKRRPFTEEEDRALKDGYEQHGTVWAIIVKDPVFQDQNRRSTDLRDRFRNAFPELYQAAGYKPRGVAKKKGTTRDDSGPVRRGRIAISSRGGTKSVPQSTANTDNEESEDDSPEPMLTMDSEMDDGEMNLVVPDFVPSSSVDSSQAWSSGVNTPPSVIPGTIGKSAWGTEDWFSANPRLDSAIASSSSGSPYDNTASSLFSFANINHSQNMMDINHARYDSSVFGRYDLLNTSLPHENYQYGSERHASFDSHSGFDTSSRDFASEVGDSRSPLDSHSAFSDPEMYAPNNFRGFTHHSSYAGDLIFGARTHQPLYGERPPRAFPYGSELSQSAGVHPMQLHTSALPGIDEIPLAGITLEDDPPKPQPNFTFPPHELDALVDLSAHENELELHATPPGTPVIHHHHHHPIRSSSSYGSSSYSHPQSHSRSYSVPPSENRAGPSRPAGLSHTNSQPLFASPSSSISPLAPIIATRSLPRFSSLSDGFGSCGWNDASSFMPLATAASSPDLMASTRLDQYDLPFLDLHYYNGMEQTPARPPSPPIHSQALDLAQSRATMAPPAVPHQFHVPPQKSQHQRVQSAISPGQVLQAYDRRKRSSWDGGMGG